jgi:AraC-like DNA-binding protein
VTLSLVNIVMIVAAAQGFLLTVLLFKKHRALLANRLLGTMILCYSIMLVNLTVTDAGYAGVVPQLVILLTGLAFLVAPLQYLYAKHLIILSKRLSPRDWLHALPFLCAELCLFGAIAVLPWGEVSPYNAAPANVSSFYLLLNWAIVLIGFVYVVLTLLLINAYHRRIKSIFSDIERLRLDWLRRITFALMGAWIIFTTENALYTAGIDLSNFNLSSLAVGLCIYAVGYWGLMKSEVFGSPDVTIALEQASEAAAASATPKEEGPGNGSAKYEKSGLSPDDASRYSRQLLQLMEDERLYVDGSLTLGKLAGRLSISPHNLSEVINTQLGKNFYDFVNSFRVEQVKKDLIDAAKQHLSILSLAFDAGFNSKTAFNTIFKELTGYTPSRYKAAFSKKTS